MAAILFHPKRLNYRPALFAILAIAYAAVGAGTGVAQPVETMIGLPDYHELHELPQEEQERVWRYQLQYPEDFEVRQYEGEINGAPQTLRGLYARKMLAVVRGAGPMEVMVAIEGPRNMCPLHGLRVVEAPINAMSLSESEMDEQYPGSFHGSRFRRLLPAGTQARVLAVWFTGEGNNPIINWNTVYEPDQYAGMQCEVSIVLTRKFNRCTMFAEVSGDLTGTYFGDAAFFNLYAEGAPIVHGNALDPGMLELLDQLTGMAATNVQAGGHTQGVEPENPDQWDLQCEEAGNGEECQFQHRERPQSFGEALRQWAAESEAEDSQVNEQGEDKLPPGYGDSFSLVLTDTKLASRPIDAGFGPIDGADRGPRPLLGEIAGGLGGFSLSASSRWQGNIDEGNAGMRVPLTSLIVLPAAMDENLDGVKFLWEQGDRTGGNATMIVHGLEENRIAGTIAANLRSEKKYEDGYLRIEVGATFVALRGMRSCQGQY